MCLFKNIDEQSEINNEQSEINKIDNILKDCQMTFVKREKTDGYHYVIQPPPVIDTPDESFIFTDELLDEIPDDDQENSCF